MIWAVVGLAVVAAGVDLWKREIPDSISIALVGLAVVGWCWPGQTAVLHRCLLGAAGAGIAAAVALALYALGGWGGGDVKLLTAVGLVVGLSIVPILLWTALAGAALAGIAAARKQWDYAYAPAIAAGAATHALWPDLLSRVAEGG
ncbi:MAG: prepilin peptidase [Pirellulales bacterium]